MKKIYFKTITDKERKKMLETMELATKIVNSWPKWKQDVLTEAMGGK